MRRFGLFLLCVSWAALACWVGCLEMRVQRLERDVPEPNMPTVHGDIRCESLTVGHGKRRISLNTTNKSAGIWISGGKACISIYAADHQTYIGIYGDMDAAGYGATIAVAVDSDGRPVVQMIDQKHYHFFRAADLEKK